MQNVFCHLLLNIQILLGKRAHGSCLIWQEFQEKNLQSDFVDKV
jgi:hypothetical protein